MITFEESKNGRLKVIPPNDKILEDLIDRYSIPNKSARFSVYAPSNLSAISPLGTFDKGLIHDIIHTLKEITYEKIDISNISDYLIKKPIRKNEKLIQPKTFNYRPYQENAINKCLDNGNGLSELPTGAGKSAIVYGICKNSISKKILILVPNVHLVKQYKRDFIEYGYTEHEVQMYSSFSKILMDKRITISNRQYLSRHPLDFDIDCQIIDEVHTICKKHSEVYKMVKSFPTPHKFGFTGTLPSCKYDVWSLMGVCGNILIRKGIEELQNKGFISNIKIQPIKIHHTSKKYFPRDTYKEICEMFRTEYQYLEENDNINEIILRISKKIKGNTIIFFDHIVHGQRLYEMSKNIMNEKHIFYVDGSVKLSDRLYMCESMENNENVLCIGNTKCVGTGINIKNIQNIIFATGGYSCVKIIQGIGRSLRLHPNKKNAVLIDIFHNYTYSNRHFEKRRKLYEGNYSQDALQEMKIIYLP